MKYPKASGGIGCGTELASAPGPRAGAASTGAESAPSRPPLPAAAAFAAAASASAASGESTTGGSTAGELTAGAIATGASAASAACSPPSAPSAAAGRFRSSGSFSIALLQFASCAASQGGANGFSFVGAARFGDLTPLMPFESALGRPRLRFTFTSGSSSSGSTSWPTYFLGSRLRSARPDPRGESGGMACAQGSGGDSAPRQTLWPLR